MGDLASERVAYSPTLPNPAGFEPRMPHVSNSRRLCRCVAFRDITPVLHPNFMCRASAAVTSVGPVAVRLRSLVFNCSRCFIFQPTAIPISARISDHCGGGEGIRASTCDNHQTRPWRCRLPCTKLTLTLRRAGRLHRPPISGPCARPRSRARAAAAAAGPSRRPLPSAP